jgi:hypothetical protein
MCYSLSKKLAPLPSNLARDGETGITRDTYHETAELRWKYAIDVPEAAIHRKWLTSRVKSHSARGGSRDSGILAGECAKRE